MLTRAATLVLTLALPAMTWAADLSAPMCWQLLPLDDVIMWTPSPPSPDGQPTWDPVVWTASRVDTPTYEFRGESRVFHWTRPRYLTTVGLNYFGRRAEMVTLRWAGAMTDPGTWYMSDTAPPPREGIVVSVTCVVNVASLTD